MEVVCVVCFFFFQAEDGIRDLTVTGVQTCALPIYSTALAISGEPLTRPPIPSVSRRRFSSIGEGPMTIGSSLAATCAQLEASVVEQRSEEHTSELQSQSNLVCRLLLEKKNDSSRAIARNRHPRANGFCAPSLAVRHKFKRSTACARTAGWTPTWCPMYHVTTHLIK